MSSKPDLSIALLHEGMYNKQGQVVTTSLTLNDIHDLARCARTYGVHSVFIVHPSPTLRQLATVMKDHWQSGYGATYNPDRKEAISLIHVLASFDEVLTRVSERCGVSPHLIATSAKGAPGRLSYAHCRQLLDRDQVPHLLMLGTGWGMTDPLLERADYILAPIEGPTDFNHLSVRSACAIMLDRLLASH